MAGDEFTLEGLTVDVKVTSERLAQLENAQIVVEGRLKAIEDAQDVSNTHLQDILTRLDELRAAPPTSRKLPFCGFTICGAPNFPCATKKLQWRTMPSAPQNTVAHRHRHAPQK